jgi:hypothetical protein
MKLAVTVVSYFFIPGSNNKNMHPRKHKGNNVVNFQVKIRYTERRGRVGNTPASYSGDPGFKSRPGELLSRLRTFMVFFRPPANLGMVP